MEATQSTQSTHPREAAASSSTTKSNRERAKLSRVLLHATIIFFCLIVILPVAWVLLMSIKSIPDTYTGLLWPKRFDFTHYAYVFDRMPNVLHNFANSIIVTFSTVAITCTVAVMAGYALVHLRLPGKVLVVSLLVATLFFPTRIVSLIGIFEVQTKLGLINTLPGLILPYVTLNLAVSILIMKSVFETISHEIVDAARIDGAGSGRTLWNVMLPLAVNGIVVLIVINFVTAWGEYLLAYTLTNDQSVRTFPVVLATVSGGFGEWAWPRIAAVYVMAILPGILGFAIAQQWYMKGLSEGAIKF